MPRRRLCFVTLTGVPPDDDNMFSCQGKYSWPNCAVAPPDDNKSGSRLRLAPRSRRNHDVARSLCGIYWRSELSLHNPSPCAEIARARL
eukprot:6446753-Pyramimonas_sp.AAC.1